MRCPTLSRALWDGEDGEWSPRPNQRPQLGGGTKNWAKCDEGIRSFCINKLKTSTAKNGFCQGNCVLKDYGSADKTEMLVNGIVNQKKKSLLCS